jgi:magnesium transporter
VRTLIVAENGKLTRDARSAPIREMLAKPGVMLWLDIEAPDQDDAGLLQGEFGFHPLAVEDAIRSHERPKIDAHGSYYFIVFYSADFRATADGIDLHGLHLFVGANFLITVHAAPIAEVSDTMARCLASGRADSPPTHDIGALVYALLDAVVDEYFPLMDRIADRIEELEDTIFIRFDETAIQTIFGLKTDLLRLRHVVSPERDVMNRLLRLELPVFRQDDLPYLQDIYDHIVRVTDTIDTYRDLLSSALDSYLSIQSNRLNEIIKVLTIASIVLMSCALVTGFYGMNFRFMPELEWPMGEAYALALMGLITVGLVIYFRKQRWL